MMWRFNHFSNQVAAITDCGESITYGELEKLSDQFHNTAFRKLVFCITNNCMGAFAGYSAMIQAGVIPVMISHDIDISLFNNLFDEYKPDYIWTPKERIDIPKCIDTIIDAYGYELKKTKFDCEMPIYDDLALLLTTSGSTGSPKFVRQSYDNIKSNMESIVEYLEIDDTERPITTLPMSYTYGLSIIHSHLTVGATILITDKTLMQKEFWQFFKKEKATSFGGVPYTYEMLKKLRFFRMELPSLRTMTQAGGKLMVELHKEFAQFASDTNRKFVVMYGQTEATARMAYLPANHALDKVGSMGIAIPGGTFSLIDVNGNEIHEVDQVGELKYSGKNVTLGYALTRLDLSKGDERGGVLETGDMAKCDKDGFYFIVGRKKRFLKIFGKRVNLDEVEGLVKSSFPSMECGCTGKDDHLVLFVTIEKKLKQVKEFVANTTKLNLSAISVKYIDSIPKNEAGKVQYRKLEELL